MRQYFLLYLFLGILFSYSPNSLSAQIVLESHVLQFEEGLAERKVYTSARDSFGFFYIFTEHFIQRWDGRTFIDISIPELDKTWEFDQVVKKVVTNSVGGIDIFPKDISDFYWQISNKENKVKKIKVSKNVNWYPNQFSSFALDEKTGEVYLLKDQQLIEVCHLNDKAEIPLKIFKIEAGHLVQYPDNGVLIKNNRTRQAVNFPGSHLVQTNAGIIYSINSKKIWKWTKEGFEFVHSFVDEYEFVGFVKSDGLDNVLVARQDTVRKINDISIISDLGKVTQMNEALSYNEKILDIVADDFFSDWLVSAYTGINIYKYNQPGFDAYQVNRTVKKGSFGQVIPSVIPLPERNGVLFFTETKGIYRYKSRAGYKNLMVDNPAWSDIFKSNQKIIEERPGIYWLYSFTYKNETNLKYFDYSNKIVKNYLIPFKINDLIKVEDKQLLLAGYDKKGNGYLSLFHIETKELKPLFKGNNLTKDALFVLYKDKMTNLIYVGGMNGLFVLDNDFQLLNHFDDAKQEENRLSNPFVRSVLRRGDYLYIGTNGGGLNVMNLSTKKVNYILNTSNGLSDNIPVAMEIDEFENLWVGTYNGLNVIDKELNIIRRFYYHEGLPSREFNTKASASLPNGNLFFGTINGLVKVNPKKALNRKSSAGIVIERIQAHYDNRVEEINPMLEDYQIYNNCDSIEVEFNLPDFYQYPRIPNELVIHPSARDYGDVSFGVDRITISNMSRGDYLLPIMDNKSGKIVNVKFRNTLNYFFIAKTIGLLLGILLLGGFLIKNITQRQRKVEEEKTKINQKISELELNALRSQMNPHFIFNAMGSVQYFIQDNDKEKADDYLSDFAHLMRLILESSKSALISIEDEINLLKLYLGLEKMRFSDKFDFQILLDDHLDMNIEIPPMIIQPFLENAINHGIYHLNNRKGEVHLRFIMTGKELICEIEDNGIGRMASKELRRKNHKSRSTQILEERIQTLNKIKTVGVAVETLDLTDGNRPRGTKVVVKFKYLND